MAIVEQFTAARYAFGSARPHDAGRVPPAYVPTGDGEPAAAASEPWSEQERLEWAAAELADYLRERGR